MEAQTKMMLGGASVVAFSLAAVAGAVGLSIVQPPVGLAAPTLLCVVEVKAIALVFLAWVAAMDPLKAALERHPWPFAGVLQRRVGLPGPVRVLALFVVVLGSSVFAFWSTADVLGGYNGYGYSFAQYPVLQTIYNDFISRIPYISTQDKGTQASFFFILACVGMVALRLEKGSTAALKDMITLFAAPTVVIFELALWHFAPQDMTWHVTDYLWMGGVADGGYRSYDTGAPYVFSNWLVLFVSIFLVASRIPWLSFPSTVIWEKDAGSL